MLFPDVGCTISDSMKRWMQDGVCDLLEADHVSVVTIRRQTKQISISAVIRLREVNEEIIQSFLESEKENFLGGTVYSNHCFNGYYFHMTSNKEAKPFIAFVLVCRRAGPFDEKALRWLDLYCSMSYQRTVVSNENIQEKNILKAIWDDSKLAFAVITAKGKVLRPNQSAISFFSLRENKMLRLPDIGQQRQLEDAMKEAMKTNRRRYLEKVILSTGQGGERVFNILIAPLEDSKGRVAGTIIMATDTTESRLLGLEVEQLRQYGILGELSAGLAHDIKNPLMSIMGSARLLKKPENRTLALYEDLANIILHETARIDSVINQMMAYADISHRLEESNVDINSILTQCTYIIERQKLSKKITMLLTLDQSMPCLWARELHLQQIFLNLLYNSLQAISQQGNISIISSYNAVEQTGTVIIEDNGIGIAPEIREKIFNPCFTTKASGTGMGLFIVKRTLAKYDADISIESAPMSGTRCTVVFRFKGDRHEA